MKLIEYDCNDPYMNLAAEEYYLRSGVGAYARLWRNHNTIVIGKNQNPYNEINLEAVRENNVAIARRMTGGGAVYHDLGNVNFTFITSGTRGAYDPGSFNEPVIGALRSLGVDARAQGRNDIAVNGRKISGSAQYCDAAAGRVLHHGTLLFNSNLNFIGECLRVADDKLKAKGVASVRSRVANISDFMREQISLASFMNTLKTFVMKEHHACEVLAPTEEDLKGIAALRESKYAAWEWIYGSSPDYNFHSHKRFEGCGGVSVYADIKHGLMSACRICGDFFGDGDVADIEALLNGRRARLSDVSTALAGIDIGGYICNLQNEDFLALFNDL